MQVCQQSPLGYLQKFAGQPVPQLPPAQFIQQQYLQATAQSTGKSGQKLAALNNNNAGKGTVEAKAGAGAQTALQLPLLRPAPPVLKPFAGLLPGPHVCLPFKLLSQRQQLVPVAPNHCDCMTT